MQQRYHFCILLRLPSLDSLLKSNVPLIAFRLRLGINGMSTSYLGSGVVDCKRIHLLLRWARRYMDTGPDSLKET